MSTKKSTAKSPPLPPPPAKVTKQEEEEFDDDVMPIILGPPGHEDDPDELDVNDHKTKETLLEARVANLEKWVAHLACYHGIKVPYAKEEHQKETPPFVPKDPPVVDPPVVAPPAKGGRPVPKPKYVIPKPGAPGWGWVSVVVT